jgi:hypothetical protein
MKHNKQNELFAFRLTNQCLETEEANEEERHFSNTEFVIAIAGVTFVVVAVRGLVWLFCGC